MTRLVRSHQSKITLQYPFIIATHSTQFRQPNYIDDNDDDNDDNDDDDEDLSNRRISSLSIDWTFLLVTISIIPPLPPLPPISTSTSAVKVGKTKDDIQSNMSDCCTSVNVIDMNDDIRVQYTVWIADYITADCIAKSCGTWEFMSLVGVSCVLLLGSNGRETKI